MQPKAVLLSLAEPCSYLISAFREYAAMLIHTKNKKIADMGHALNYNDVPFMTQLLKEIFEDQPQLSGLRQLPESTKILIRDGMDERTAQQVAATAFRTTIGAICTVLPNIKFGPNHGYSFDLVEPTDLWVTIPQPVHYEEETEEY